MAWTIISLFNPAGEPEVGRWRCPLYKCPTKLGLDMSEVASETVYTGLDLFLRIGDPKDNRVQEAF